MPSRAAFLNDLIAPVQDCSARVRLRDRRLIQLLILALMGWTVIFGRASLGPLQETMARDLALSDPQVALLQGPAAGLPFVLFSIPFGILLGRYSNRALCWGLMLLN